LLQKKVDAGNILKRVKPNINCNDNYYTINYKTIKLAIDSLPKVAQKYLNSEIELIKQNISSKVYKKSDFNEEVLFKVLEKYGKKIDMEELKTIKESKKCVCCQ